MPDNTMSEDEPVKVLIVDDLKENLLALAGVLRRDDLEVFSARSGTEALEFLMSHEFALALIDVRMPGMSGFELAELMRGAKKTKHIPIIFVTATARDQSFSFKGYERGAVDFLLKPLDTYAVKSKVSVFIELYRQKKSLKKQLATITGLIEAVSRAKTEAETANASKSQFLAMMAHEIRTPVGAIVGFTELIKNVDTTAANGREYLAIVERNAQQLARLVDDVLDLSKVEAGMMTTEIIQFSLADTLADFTADMASRAADKGVEFRFKADTAFPDQICSDPHRLRQILTNIVGNALKFTEKGYVELRIAYDRPVMRFTIRDTGLGISKAQRLKLFQPFTQADLSTTRKFGGTGLGLVLSRRLAEALGGKLDLVASRQGEGSTFVVEVTAALPPEAKLIGGEALTHSDAHVAKRNALCGLKVLLVEDSPDNQLLISTYLRVDGASVKAALNGAQGVELAMAGDFDVLLMDVQMPILDGHEATRRLRTLNYGKPIVALTAHAMQEERIKCMESGFTEFLTKPVHRGSLVEILSRYLPGG